MSGFPFSFICRNNELPPSKDVRFYMHQQQINQSSWQPRRRFLTIIVSAILTKRLYDGSASSR